MMFPEVIDDIKNNPEHGVNWKGVCFNTWRTEATLKRHRYINRMETPITSLTLPGLPCNSLEI